MKFYPIYFSWNSKKLGHIIRIHRDWTFVHGGVERVVQIILPKHVGVENPYLFFLDRSLKIKIGKPPMSPHLLIHLHGAKHAHVLLYDN